MERNKLAVVLIALGLLIAPSVALAQSLETHTASSGAVYVTTDGLEVTLTDDRQIERVPFEDNQTFANGTLSVSSPSNAEIAINEETYAGDKITITNIKAPNGITVNRSDITKATLYGDYSEFSFGEISARSEGMADLSYAGASDGSVRLTGLPNIGIAAVDTSTGEVYDSTVVADNGTGKLSLPDGNEDIDIQESAANLEVYNESNPTELVDSTEVEVTFFGDDRTTVTRSATDGVIDFAGLPLDERFIARIDAEGYQGRTVTIPSLVEQERAYVLPENETSVQIRFRLDDATGTYSERSTVYVEKPITINNETSYQIITADRFGANGFVTSLEKGVRYNLRMENERGTTAELSAYRPEISETVVLEPSAASVQKPEDESIGYEIRYDEDNDVINIEYIDPADKTDELFISVKSKRGDTVLKPKKQYTGPSSLSLAVDTNGSLEQEYYVNITGQRAGDSIDIQESVGPPQTIVTPSSLPIGWQQVVATMLILLVAGIFSSLNAGVGILVTALFGGVLWFFGLMSGLASGGAVGLGIGIATLNLLRR